MLLAFDTATPLVTVALHDGEDVVVELPRDRPMKHAEQLAPLVDEAMRRVGIVRQDLTAIAAGVGPGPFTGLRVGLVTARTLGFVLDIPVYGVCSLDVIAIEAADTGAVDGDFVVATDARRKEVYLARYDAEGNRLEGPVVDKPADARHRPARGGGGRACSTPTRSLAAAGRAPERRLAGPGRGRERVELADPEPLYLRRPDAVAPPGSQAGLVTVRPATPTTSLPSPTLEDDNLGVDAWSEG